MNYTLRGACRFVATFGKYKLDDSRSLWRPITPEEPKGDCEDHVLGVGLAFFVKWLAMIGAIITGRMQIHRVITKSGEKHAVGCIDGMWFDNNGYDPMTKAEFLAKTGHVYKSQRNRFFILWKLTGPVAGPILVGLAVVAITLTLIKVLS